MTIRVQGSTPLRSGVRFAPAFPPIHPLGLAAIVVTGLLACGARPLPTLRTASARTGATAQQVLQASHQATIPSLAFSSRRRAPRQRIARRHDPRLGIPPHARSSASCGCRIAAMGLTSRGSMTIASSPATSAPTRRFSRRDHGRPHGDVRRRRLRPRTPGARPSRAAPLGRFERSRLRQGRLLRYPRPRHRQRRRSRVPRPRRGRRERRRAPRERHRGVRTRR